jgi:2-C-methyl-D-erythritol 4-phosphate cytidylyltransferase/2-C-methyl-D-erythritol 2,4-cyclodiphosphate synthase
MGMRDDDPWTYAAVIVAAGRGLRAGGDIPKQWQNLAGRRVIDWSIAAFRANPHIGRVVVVVHEDDVGFLDQMEIEVVTGGATRSASVRAGLEALAGDPPDAVLIHDAARATVPDILITDICRMLEACPAAAPGLEVTDALWSDEGAQDTRTVARSVARVHLYRAQTPQGFHFQPILAAHRAFEGEAADDVAVARAAGLSVRIGPGHPDNIKITRTEDFARAERILKEQRGMDVRVGNGFDVHRFGPGDHVVLCGVNVPHARALQGHSDADVGMHAVTDAIYGALAEGDIGRHFPPSDPQWKGAASEIFLSHAVALAGERSFRISNADVTLICEEPKIAPHAAAMQARMAEIMGLERSRVSVKATTSERLGFTGRGEGIAAMASVTLVTA